MIQVQVEVVTQADKDLLIAECSALGFEGFEEQENLLLCYISTAVYNANEVAALMDKKGFAYQIKQVPAQNWNALWESNFEPVTVGDFCTIRAHFHAKDTSVMHEVVITPKMSFGTGHHATTWLMVQQMSHLELKGKAVADFGTGTGILAILAEKLGSSYVWAIDCDDYSMENAAENIERNNSKVVKLEKSDVFSPVEKFDIILANINKNVIIDNLGGLIFGLNTGGKLLLSGLLKEDENDVLMAFQGTGLSRVDTVERNNWITILLEK